MLSVLSISVNHNFPMSMDYYVSDGRREEVNEFLRIKQIPLFT